MVNHVYTRLKSRMRRRWRLWSRQKSSQYQWYISCTILVLLLWVLLHGGRKQVHEPRIISLKDQPTYLPPSHRACKVKICNPSGRCSMWAPGVYQWQQLADQSIYRDVASVDVGFGCQVTLRVDQGVEQTELLTVANEKLICTDDLAGLDTLCRNVIEVDVECKFVRQGGDDDLTSGFNIKKYSFFSPMLCS